MPEQVDQEARWLEIQRLSDAIARKDSAPSELESALCGAVWRAREWKQALSERVETPDLGTEKLLLTLLDRAYKMMMLAGYRVMEHDPDQNDPIGAWMSDARAVLYGSTKPEPDLARLK